MQDIVTIEYDQMRRIAEEFQDVSETVHSVLSELQKQKDTLQQGGWSSEAATQFYKHMDDNILPAVQRLEASLQRSRDTCRDIIRTFEMAEEEAARCITLEWFELRDDRDGGLNGAKDADTLFINGIDNTHENHMSGITDVSDALDGVPVTGIYNKSDGRLEDLFQAGNDILTSWTQYRFGDNPAVYSAVGWFSTHPEGEIIVHSQGAAIISASLVIAKEIGIDISGLKVITLGGAGNTFPEGPTYHHLVHVNDPIPKLANNENVKNNANGDYHLIDGDEKGKGAHNLKLYLDEVERLRNTGVL